MNFSEKNQNRSVSSQSEMEKHGIFQFSPKQKQQLFSQLSAQFLSSSEQKLLNSGPWWGLAWTFKSRELCLASSFLLVEQLWRNFAEISSPSVPSHKFSARGCNEALYSLTSRQKLCSRLKQLFLHTYAWRQHSTLRADRAFRRISLSPYWSEKPRQ